MTDDLINLACLLEILALCLLPSLKDWVGMLTFPLKQYERHLEGFNARSRLVQCWLMKSNIDWWSFLVEGKMERLMAKALAQWGSDGNVFGFFICFLKRGGAIWECY